MTESALEHEKEAEKQRRRLMWPATKDSMHTQNLHCIFEVFFPLLIFFYRRKVSSLRFYCCFSFTSSEKNLKRISKNPLHCIKITKESYRLPKYILWNPLELEFTAARWIENKSLKSFCRRLFSPCLSLSCVYGVMLSCQLATAGRR